MRARLLPVALAAAAVVLTACPDDPASDPGSDVSSVPSSTPSPGGTVVFGVLGEPETLDPYSPVASDLTWWLGRPVFPSLYRRAPGGKPSPDLAASIVFFEGGATIVLEQRRWSDGKPVTAGDVVASIRRAVPPSGFARVEEARATGPRTVEMRGDVSNWEKALATRAYILPGGEAKNLKLSAGPFVVRSRVPGLEVVYGPNPAWTGKPPSLDRVRIQSIQSVETMLALLERGRLDAAAVPSTVNIDERLEERDLTPIVGEGGETIVLDLAGSAPTQASRAAIVRAIDRRALAEGLIRDDGRVLTSRVPKASAAHLAIQVAAPAGDELLLLMQRVIQRHLQSESIDAELVVIEPETFYGAWERDDPVDVALRRRGVVTGSEGLDSVPLFEVNTFIALRTDVLGLMPYASLEGPLWNVEAWSLGG